MCETVQPERNWDAYEKRIIGGLGKGSISNRWKICNTFLNNRNIQPIRKERRSIR